MTPDNEQDEAGAGDAQSMRQIELMDLLGYIYLRHGQPDKAAVLMAARDVLAPGDARALLTLALAQVRSERPERALDTLERLALIGGVGAGFHLVRAQALQALNRADEAASAMRAHVAARAAEAEAGAGAAVLAPTGEIR